MSNEENTKPLQQNLVMHRYMVLCKNEEDDWVQESIEMSDLQQAKIYKDGCDTKRKNRILVQVLE